MALFCSNIRSTAGEQFQSFVNTMGCRRATRSARYHSTRVQQLVVELRRVAFSYRYSRSKAIESSPSIAVAHTLRKIADGGVGLHFGRRPNHRCSACLCLDGTAERTKNFTRRGALSSRVSINCPQLHTYSR